MEHILNLLGGWVEENEGIVGHIKCSIKSEHIVSISYTDDHVQTKESDGAFVVLSFASIVFGIDQQILKNKVVELLNPIVL